MMYTCWAVEDGEYVVLDYDTSFEQQVKHGVKGKPIIAIDVDLPSDRAAVQFAAGLADGMKEQGGHPEVHIQIANQVKLRGKTYKAVQSVGN